MNSTPYLAGQMAHVECLTRQQAVLFVQAVRGCHGYSEGMASARRGARVAWFAGARVGRQEQDPLLSGCLPIARGPGGQARSPSRARPRSAMSCLASTAGLPVSRLAENAEAVSIACRNRQALPR